MGGKGSGRKAIYHDEYHRVQRKIQRIYTEKNREALRLAGRLQIPVAEARKRLGIEAKKERGKRKKRGKK